jgi:hypothetical protein
LLPAILAMALGRILASKIATATLPRDFVFAQFSKLAWPLAPPTFELIPL